jgi:hypothetical protein
VQFHGPHFDADLPRAGVPNGVADRFLDDAVNAGAMIFRQILGAIVREHVDLNGAGSGNLARKPVQRR